MKKEDYPFWFFCSCALFFVVSVTLHEYPVEIVITKSVVSSKNFSNATFDSNRIKSIRHSVLKICYEIYDHNDKVISSGCGHCYIYSNNGNNSYLALPQHCFPYDETKRYQVWVTDYAGRTFELKHFGVLSHGDYDAEMLVTEKFFGLPSLCEVAILTGYRAFEDSAFVFDPFNARNVERKWGTFLNEDAVEMSTMICEPGDSGGLVISREGISGVVVSASGNGSTMQYVPILVFEHMYGKLVFNKN
jgi:hypothetical protein